MALISVFVAAGCSSPEDKAAKYYQRGMELLAKGDVGKARVELQNALQIKKDLNDAWYGLALVAERQGEWERMYSVLNSVVDRDPRHLEAQLKLGRLMLAAGELDRALRVSDLTLELDKNKADVLALRAAVLFKLDDRKGAVDQAMAALAKDPKNADAAAVLATERLTAGDAERAIGYLDTALAGNEKNVALQLIKVQALEKLAKVDNAEGVFRKLISLYPETPVFRHVLAKFYLSHGKADKAEAEYRAIAKENPKNANAKLDIVRFVGQTKGPEAGIKELNGMIAAEPDNSELKFALVSIYQARNDRKSAESLLRTLVTQLGDSQDGLKAKGTLSALMLAAGDKKGATTLVDEILVKDQRNEQALLIKATVAIDDRKLDSAIADLRTLLKDAPNSARALALLGKAHELAGAPELAQEQYQKAFQQSKYAAPFGLAYAEFLLRRGQASRAEDVVDGILKTSTGNLAAMRMLAQARINQRNWAGAQAIADELRKAGVKQSSEQVAGAVHLAKREYSASISSFKRAYEASSGDMQSVVSLVRTYLAAGKTGEALSFVNSVVKATPNSVGARMLQGQVMTVKGDLDGAAQAFRSAIELKPDLAAAYVGLAETHMRAKRFPEAQKAVEAGLAKVPGDFALRLSQAGVFETSGKIDDAIKAYEQILKDRPNADVAANNLASLLSDHRTDKVSLSRAQDLAQRFRKSDVPQFKDTLAWVSHKLGRNEDALSLLQDATKQMPDAPVLRYHLGMVHLSKNNKSGARKEFEKALELAKGRDFAEADEVRKALKGL